MKIVICGSIAFIEEMEKTQQTLQHMGHDVLIPPLTIPNGKGGTMPVEEFYKLRQTAGDEDLWIWERKRQAMRAHFEKIVWSDVILVMNRYKNRIDGYVGSNTLIEMGLAFFLGKTIFLYRRIPDMPCREEILGFKPRLLNSSLSYFENNL